ncbi:MAG: helix-turn-helix domain-containing protein [Spirochaetaceae bacterium]|jgi:cytoskeletal protein RodZ|nr:helix-turn-helix domain-containing protein [Spirochaetaceae bacterium]
MTIIGEKLKAAREAKGYSVEHVSRETNIAKRYIEALEAGDFSHFPAEAYLIGFLKNYGEYLALDGKELQAQYRMHKIQEQPIPVEQLLKEPSRIPNVIITAVISLFAGAFIFAIVFYLINRPRWNKTEQEGERKPVVYTLTEGIFEERMYAGDSLKVPLAGNDWNLTLQKIGDILTLAAPAGELLIGLNDTAFADLNGDGEPDLTILAQDFLPGKPEMGAQLHIEAARVGGMMAAAQGADGQMPAVQVPVPETPPASSTGGTAVFTGNTPYPFSLEVRFQSYCMLRWEILREANQGRNERYFVKGDVLNIQAQNGVRLWVSNAAAAKTLAIGGGRQVALDFGLPGEIVVIDINWVRDTDGRYKLIQTRLES